MDKDKSDNEVSDSDMDLEKAAADDGGNPLGLKKMGVHTAKSNVFKFENTKKRKNSIIENTKLKGFKKLID